MPPADNTPDFDKMTPEEIMAWMESLAKRQGAPAETFTTSADMVIAEIDPDSVVIDEPGYVPSEGKMKGQKIESITHFKPAEPAKPAPAAAAPPPPVQQPLTPPPAAVAPPPAQKPAPAVQQPAAQKPAPAAPPPAPAPQPAAEPTSALSWLESLAADQGGDFPSLDLSSIAADLAPTTSSATPAAPAPAGNPVDWLESLSQGQGMDNVLPPLEPEEEEPAVASPPDWLTELSQGQVAPAAPTPAAETPAAANPVDWLESLSQGQGVQEVPPVTPAPAEAGDPVSWLESLARHQGAPTEELTTPANLNIELPENPVSDGPGYTGYTFETPDTFIKQNELNIPASQPPAPQPASEAEMQDPSAWLDALATSKGTPEPKPAAADRHLSDDEIQKALAKGEVVPHDQMEAWMNRQLEMGAQREEPPELEAFDPDAPAVKAEIPDWLLEQVGSAPPEEVTQPLPPSAPPLIETIFEPPAVSNIPDWLKEEEPASASEFEDIFAPTPNAPSPVAVTSPASGAIQIDPNDPWVEALEMEYAQGKGGTAAPPEVTLPPAQPPAAAPAAALKEAALQPETDLPAGQPEPVPDWLQGLTNQTEEPAAIAGDIPDWLMAEVETPSVASEQPAVAGDMPDWLRSVDIEAAEVPAWLTETLGTASEEVSEVVLPPVMASSPIPAPAPAPVPAAPPARTHSPAPVPARAANIDVPATLSNARSSASSNDIEGSLRHYEQLIRANAELDSVVDDLTKMSEKVKTHPAVYRVLGDGLMRQGKLQNALDIYRRGLNQL